MPFQKPFAESNDLLEGPEGKIVPDQVVKNKSFTKKSKISCISMARPD